MPTSTTNKPVVVGFAYHCHHDELFEFVTDFERRVKYIKEYKSGKERPLRLRLFKMVPKELLDPDTRAFIRRYTRLVIAERAAKFVRSYLDNEQNDALWHVLSSERANLMSNIPTGPTALIGRLHKRLCPKCPWSSKKKTIFTRRHKNGVWY
mgnify:CR=1 FL=1